MILNALRSATAICLLSAVAFPSIANAFDDSEKKEIGEIVREYLLEHPETLIDMQQALEKKQSEARQQQAKAAVEENHDAIFNSPYDVAVGNPQGKITVVEFFDYNCGYCKRALSDMDAIVKTNPDVRFVLKEFPILGPDSLAAHKVSDAFRRLEPSKYLDFHRQLLGSSDHANEASAIEVARALGVSEDAIRAEMAKDSGDESVKQAYELATRLGISGTPSYVIGDEAVFGAVGAETISEKIANLTQCGKATC